MKYLVEFSLTFEVDADSEDEAVEYARDGANIYDAYTYVTEME